MCFNDTGNGLVRTNTPPRPHTARISGAPAITAAKVHIRSAPDPSQAQDDLSQGYRPQPLSAPTISAPPHSSTTIGIEEDERRSEPGADGTRTGPADLRSGRAGALPAAQLYSPARA